MEDMEVKNLMVEDHHMVENLTRGGREAHFSSTNFWEKPTAVKQGGPVVGRRSIMEVAILVVTQTVVMEVTQVDKIASQFLSSNAETSQDRNAVLPPNVYLSSLAERYQNSSVVQSQGSNATMCLGNSAGMSLGSSAGMFPNKSARMSPDSNAGMSPDNNAGMYLSNAGMSPDN